MPDTPKRCTLCDRPAVAIPNDPAIDELEVELRLCTEHFEEFLHDTLRLCATGLPCEVGDLLRLECNDQQPTARQ